eukprot:1027281-Amphidinium_carterae.1
MGWVLAEAPLRREEHPDVEGHRGSSGPTGTRTEGTDFLEETLIEIYARESTVLQYVRAKKTLDSSKLTCAKQVTQTDHSIKRATIIVASGGQS